MEKLEKIKTLFSTNETGLKGIEALLYIINHPAASSLKNKLVVDFTLARGLNYYTGSIFEIKALHVQIGSIGGGGRYDDLTGLFGLPNIPGVGISFGVDRIYDVLEELKLFPQTIRNGTTVLFFNLGETESNRSFELMQQLRSKGISAQLYHEQAKFEKQFKYAEKKNIPFVVMVGSRELENNCCNVKKLSTGEQISLSLDELSNYSFNA
jgi:histidyl-tRNA synthetase